MAKTQPDGLSRRERQVMDVVYRLGRASAAEIRALMPEAPSYSAVRAHLRILEEKGHLRHEQDGPRYLFVPTVPRDQARRSALRQIVRTFFEGSTAQAVAALIDGPDANLSDEELGRIAAMIEQARKEGR
jgi:predicted transcriptional regulator